MNDVERGGRVWVLAVFLLIALWGEASGQDEIQPLETHSENVASDRNKPQVTSKQQSRIKVTFDKSGSSIVIVEAGGERLRIDTAKQTVESVALEAGPSKAADISVETPPKTEAAEAQDESPYDFDSGDEPYDYRLINVPTPKKVPKGTWNLAFTHRFTQPIHPLDSSARELFGLDSFGVASFGVSYGITDKLYVSAYRSPLCQRGLCRTIELGVGYNFLEQNKESPIAVAAYASVEGNGNFTEEYTYNLQARLSARLGKRVYLFFSPAVHLNTNGQGRFNPRANEFFPPATVANSFRLPTNGASFGFGTSVLITPTIVALFEFTPRTGFKLGRVTPIFGPGFNVTGFQSESEPEIGFGIQRNIGKHSFALTFSNTQTTTTSKYNSSNLVFPARRLVIGFNLSRRF